MKVKVRGKAIEGTVVRVIRNKVKHPSYVIDTDQDTLVVPIHEVDPISGEFTDELVHQLLFAGLNQMTIEEEDDSN